METALLQPALLLIVLAPLVGSLVSGLSSQLKMRAFAHWIAIAAVLVSALLSVWVFYHLLQQDVPPFNQNLYTLFQVGDFNASVGLMVDRLTALMMVVVTCVALLVHIYSVGYMVDDQGYARFFSYLNLFTFAMLMLVMSNNFVQLFFGWEGVGCVSYLLIGFWYQRGSAVRANFKAFIVNRVGDLFFLVGIGAILNWFHSFDYATVFANSLNFAASQIQILPGHSWSILTVICTCLLIGAMAKSAQIPFHIWLPDSMEGPTPISALIHAATMVTAGIFLVVRMAPLFQYSPSTALWMLGIGAATALLMGCVGLVQNDIKRVIAYSTLSQLGYMTAALGVYAYSAALFHLVMHAFFKALLFLAAGAVILFLHHEQDLRKMGGLWRQLPFAYIASLVGTCALVGVPLFSGFYSKDAIIESTALFASYSHSQWVWLAHAALVASVFITSVYSFRLFFLTFHGPARWQGLHQPDNHQAVDQAKEATRPLRWVIVVPLILLALPSALLGYFSVGPLLLGQSWNGPAPPSPIPGQTDQFFTGILDVNAVPYQPLKSLSSHFISPWAYTLDHLFSLPVLLTVFGACVAAVVRWWPQHPTHGRSRRWWVREWLHDGYGVDWLLTTGVQKLAYRVSRWLSRVETVCLDRLLTRSLVQSVHLLGRLLRRLQSGFLYHYAFVMILGVIALLTALYLSH